MSSTPASVAPAASARSVARWITGPSASGSENGTPTSRTSAPEPASVRKMSAVAAMLGSPAVTYVTRPVRLSALSRANTCSMRDMIAPLEHAFDRLHVLVAAARQVHEQDGISLERRRHLAGVSDAVSRFERRDDAFGARQFLERPERLLVGGVVILGPAGSLKGSVFRPDRRVIQPCGDRMCRLDVAVRILEHPGVSPL